MFIEVCTVANDANAMMSFTKMCFREPTVAEPIGVSHGRGVSYQGW